MRSLTSAKFSRAAMAIPVSLVALAAMGCSGSDVQGYENAIAASSSSGDALSQSDPGSKGSPTKVDDAGSSVVPPVEMMADAQSVTRDAGPPPDAGSPLDTAPQPDAGPRPDAGSPLDTAPQPNAPPVVEAAPPSTPAPVVSSGGLSLRVVGNHIVDANSRTVRLLGVNRSGQEFKCIQEGSPGALGWGVFDGPTDLPSVQAIASWHANTVRVPLNEDCWLGINGVSPTWGGAAYRAAIAAYVSTIHEAGLYVILDLHWNAPGTLVAGAQQPLPDADHAVDFWRSVATQFAADPAVVFDLYNEPFLYGTYLQSSSEDPWDCWLNGCGLNQYLTGGTPYTQSYTWNAVGMQTLVTAIRGVGAKNPLMVGGLAWANDMSGWLTHEPQDPQHAIIASWHSYPGEGCNNIACWTSTIAPIALQVPVVTGEIGDNVGSPATYVDSLLPWEDAHGISYIGWTWNAWGDSANILISDYSGTPSADFGQKFHDHLVGLSP